MKATFKLFLFFLFLLPIFVKAEIKEIPFTLDDRDRILRTEQKVEALQTEMNARFESIDKRFDQLFNFLYAIIGIFTVMTASVFGFAFWDRKTSLEPVKNDNLKTFLTCTKVRNQ